MAYFGTTQLSSVSNPPRQLVMAFASVPAGGVGSSVLTTQGSTVAGATPSGSVQGSGVWSYCSTNLTTDLTVANFFSDAYYIGMRAGDIVIGTQFTSAGSSVITFQGAITSVSTAGAALSSGSVMTSTFN